MSIHGWDDKIDNGSMKGLLVRAGAMALLIAGLAGCSAVPDWANPLGESKAADSPSETSGFPELSDVPGEKPATTSAAQQKEIASGLAADRAAAKHSDEVLRGGTEPPAPAPQVTSPAPVKPLEDVPPEAEEKKSSNEAPKLLPMPGRGGHSSLAAAKRIQTAEADMAKAVEPEAETKPDPNAEQPVNASPTTPVEVKPGGGADKAKL